MPGYETLYNLPTGQIQVGDVVLCHGMRVRIDSIRPYHPHGRDCMDRAHGSDLDPCPLAWSCPGTVLNVREAIEEYDIPRSFLYDSERAARGHGHGREDHWAVQGNNLARWTVQRDRPYWTLAYRKPTGPVFHRVTDWCGTWQQAHDLTGEFMQSHPGLEVWYTVTREAELDGYSSPEDIGNIMVSSGRRIRIADNGTIHLP
jgi:hypothetical protein